MTDPNDAKGLAYYLCASPVSARPVVSSVSPPVVSSASPATLAITGSRFYAAGSPDVVGVTVGSYDVPFAAIAVVSGTSLSVTLPAGAIQGGAGSYDVLVTVNGGATSLPGSSSRVAVYNDPGANGVSVPVIAAVDPSGGPETGGSTVTIYGSGFDVQGAASQVTFGGVPATKMTVDSDTEITAVVPPYSQASGGTTCRAGNDPLTDVCQTDVQVTADGRTSSESTLEPEYSGPVPPPPSATGIIPAPTEFDYLPAPRVTGVEFPYGAKPYASNIGLTLVIIKGVGLGELGLQWIDVGRPGSSAAVDDELLSVSSTALRLVLPPTRPTRRPETLQIAAQTLGSPNLGNLRSREEPSTTTGVVYAPQPTVTSISTTNHLLVGPDSGGTRITVKGYGFEDGPYVEFEDLGTSSFGTEYDVRPSRTSPNTELTVTTTPQLPGVYNVVVCNDASCAYPANSINTFCSPTGCVVLRGRDDATFTFYPPGNPKVTSVSPKAGPAGETVAIVGDDLGYVQAVRFGRAEATEFENVLSFPTFTEEGNLILAVVPKGTVGKTVYVTVVTAESASLRHPESPINQVARFTYTKPKRRKR